MDVGLDLFVEMVVLVGMGKILSSNISSENA